MGFFGFGKSKKQKEKEAADLQALNDELASQKSKLAEAQRQKEEALKKQKDIQIEIDKVKKSLDAGEDAFNTEKAKYDAEMAKLAAHNKVIAEVEDQKKKALAAKAALEAAQRSLQEEKDQEIKEVQDLAQDEAKAADKCTAAKMALSNLENSKDSHSQQLAASCIGAAFAKKLEVLAKEQHSRMVLDLDQSKKCIPSAKERLAEAKKKIQPTLDAHAIALKLLEEKRSIARAQEEVEAKARGALGVVQEELATVQHSKKQCDLEYANTEKTRSAKAIDLSVIQREITDLDKRYIATKQDIQETTLAQQNAEERLEAARLRFAVEQGTLEHSVKERKELEEKVDRAEEDLRTAKAARERSDAQLETLKAEMTAKITELTWVQKECSELRTMSNKSLKDLSTFVEKRNDDLRSYRANQGKAIHEAAIAATERQRIHQKETTDASNMSLLNSQSVRPTTG